MKTRWALLLIVVAIVTIPISSFYVLFNGNPIERVKFRSEFEKYVSRNFSQSIVIDNVNYAFDSGYYYANVHVKKNKKIQFQVSYLYNKISDDYNAQLWEQDIFNKLGSQVSTIFNHKATLSSDINLTDSLYQYGERGDKIPHYFTLQKELESSSKVSELVSSTFITVMLSYDYSNNQVENQKLYTLLNLIQKEVPCDTVDIMYKSKSLHLDEYDRHQIKSFKDIPKYVE